MEIPVVEVGPYKLKAPITIDQLRITLHAATDRRDQLEKINDKAYRVNASGIETINKGDRFSYWLSRHYLAIINFFLVLYVALPFLAPVFKKIHWDGAAQVVYKMYSPLYHQWAFRSFFLFGEQAYYPHAAANIPGVLNLEDTSAEKAQGQVAPTYKHFLDALDLDPSPSTAAQARAALEAITARQKYRLRGFQG